MKYRKKFAWIAVLILCLLLSAVSGFADPTQDSSSDAEEPVLNTSSDYDPSVGYPLQERISIRARQALICSLDGDTIVYSYNIDEKVYPASLAKIMTCLVASELAPMDTPITVSANVLWDVGDGGTAELCVGETLCLKDMLYCAMLTSGNDACNAIAEGLCGSCEAFVDKLNQKAVELGCTGTHFANTHGLHDWEEYTTLRDLMVMTKEALKNPDLEEIFMAVEYTLPETKYHDSRTLITSNYIVTDASTPRYYYPAAHGIKSGFTSVSGCSVITTGEVNGMRLLVIAASAPSEEELNGEIVMHCFPSAKTLLQYAFNNFKYTTVLLPEIPVSQLPVSGGEADSVIVAPAHSVGIIVPEKYDTQKLQITVKPLSGASVQAPFTTKDVIGIAEVSYQGDVIASAEVVPITDVAAAQIKEEEQKNDFLEIEDTSSFWKTVCIILVIAILLYLVFYFCRNLLRQKKHAARRDSAASAKRAAESATVRVRTVRVRKRSPVSRALHRLRRKLFGRKKRKKRAAVGKD